MCVPPSKALTVNIETHGLRTILNKETDTSRVYGLDSYVDVGPAVSLFHYAKGDAGLPDYAPDFSPQLLGAR